MSPSDARVHLDTASPSRVAGRDGLDLLTWDGLDDLGIEAAVTTRHGGVSTGPFASLNLALHVGDDPAAVLENRRRAAATLGASVDDLVVANQVHGTRAAAVGDADRGRGARSADTALVEVDAMVTAAPGVVLTVLVADCAPVVLFDPEARVLGCAHAGWRGALHGVLESTLDSMAALGATPRRTVVAVGPTIAADEYEVGPDVVDAALAHLGAGSPTWRPGRAGHFFFDLASTVRAVLVRAGVPAAQIVDTGVRTGPPGPFFSARQEGTCGRFGLLARIRS